MSHRVPFSFNLFEPPDPPDAEDPDGGESGTMTVRSAPESMVRSMSSCGRGIGERFELSRTQLSAMIVQRREQGRYWTR